MTMTRENFIDALRRFAACGGVGIPDEYGHPDYRGLRGDEVIATGLADYLEQLPIPASWDRMWCRDLGLIVVEAFAAFRTEPAWKPLRDRYRTTTSRDVPDLIAACGGVYRTLAVMGVARLLAVLSGETWLKVIIEERLNAEMTVIDHAWRRFSAVAYRKLIARIRDERHRGNKGVFGNTTLLTWACAGRVMFTFERGDATMTYVADDSDPLGYRSGPNEPGAPYTECVAMIDDVTTHWDPDKLVRCDTAGIG